MYIRPKKQRKYIQKDKVIKKKEIDHKLRDDYTSMRHINADKLSIKLNKLTYGIIDGHEIYAMDINGYTTVRFNLGWVEFIIFFIYKIMNDNPDTFINVLMKNEITTSNLIVDRIYGNVSYTRGGEYKVYNIYDTDYCMEAILSPEVIYSAVIHIMNYIEKSCAEVVISLRRKEQTNKASGENGASVVSEDGTSQEATEKVDGQAKPIRYTLLDLCKNDAYKNDDIQLIKAKVLGTESDAFNLITVILQLILQLNEKAVLKPLEQFNWNDMLLGEPIRDEQLIEILHSTFPKSKNLELNNKNMIRYLKYLKNTYKLLDSDIEFVYITL